MFHFMKSDRGCSRSIFIIDWHVRLDPDGQGKTGQCLINKFPFQNPLSLCCNLPREKTMHVGLAQNMNNQITSICRPCELHDIKTFGKVDVKAVITFSALQWKS